MRPVSWPASARQSRALYQAGILTSREQVQVRVHAQRPEAVVLSAERLHRRALLEVPDADRLVFTARDNELAGRVEDGTRDVVEVSAARVDLPCLGLAHAPEPHGAVVRSGQQERERGMKHSPVDPAVVALEHVLDGREVIVRVELTARARRLLWRALAKTGDVPDADRLVHGGRDDEVLLRVEERAHDEVGVPSENGDAVARRAVPHTNRLVIGGGDLRNANAPFSKRRRDTEDGSRSTASRDEIAQCEHNPSGREECTSTGGCAASSLRDVF
jgi:hypothetical protein